jgi:hypothetical protein
MTGMIQCLYLNARLILLAALPLVAFPGACASTDATSAPATYSGCSRQQAVCEASCEPRELPGSSEKEPATRGDLEAERCREQCRSAGCSGP